MKRNLAFLVGFALLSVLFYACKDEDDSASPDPSLSFSASSLTLEEVMQGLYSPAQAVQIEAVALTKSVNFAASAGFQVSTDGENFSTSVFLRGDALSEGGMSLFVRAEGLEVGTQTGQLTASSTEIEDVVLPLQVEVLRRNSFLMSPNSIRFDGTPLGGVSEAQEVSVIGEDLTSEVTFTTDEGFEVSEDGNAFGTSVVLAAERFNGQALTLFVRQKGLQEGEATGQLTATSTEFEAQSVALTGEVTLQDLTVKTFNQTHLAFGQGHSQSSEQRFSFPEDLSQVSDIKMFVKLECPRGGCNAWDVFAHVQVKDPESGEWYEMGRYITPYGVDNAELARGFEIDVTDFRSLLQGEAELRSYIEVWGSDGWLLSVEFDFLAGQPEYAYSSIARVMEYNRNSLEGVPYGQANLDPRFDLTKSISLPAEAEAAHLRTIITGWGHATPTDEDGRPCAEWCYRTHNVLLDGTPTYQHQLEPLGCDRNPVRPQSGNWRPDRAGWCPGMAVPVRYDELESPSGRSFDFEYQFENWVADGGNTSGQGGAFYAISTFVVVQSNSPIEKASVMD